MVHLSGFGRDDAKSFQARLDAAAAKNDLAKDHADEFVGMTPEQAREHADGLGLMLRLAESGRPMSHEYRHGRITGLLRDGIIERVSIG